MNRIAHTYMPDATPSSGQPRTRVPGADGKASNPDAMLRFLANRFPGNVDV
jgi:hypothetical protein